MWPSNTRKTALAITFRTPVKICLRPGARMVPSRGITYSAETWSGLVHAHWFVIVFFTHFLCCGSVREGSCELARWQRGGRMSGLQQALHTDAATSSLSSLRWNHVPQMLSVLAAWIRKWVAIILQDSNSNMNLLSEANYFLFVCTTALPKFVVITSSFFICIWRLPGYSICACA